MSAVEDAVLAAFHVRITKVYPEEIRACLDQLTDEQIWWRPNEKSNSIGNLVVHLSGSLNHYLNLLIGGVEYQRDRDAEFAERRRIPKAELLGIFNDMVAKATKTFDGITTERLASPSPEPRMYKLLVDDLIGIVTHVSTHTGQILWVTKMLAEGGLDDLWIKTHKDLGAWPGRQPREAGR